jgi:uncharacterized protein
MKSFSLLIKPVSADCNLRCEYCFYIDHLENVEKKPRMSNSTLESMIASYMRTDQNNQYAFGWQGGEPTLLGLEFWKKVVQLQAKYAPPRAVISNGLQTNGTLITDDLAKLFAEYKFLLGVSLDGPPNLHDHYRKTLGNTATHNLVMRGIDHLKKRNVEFNILTLVNNKNVKRPKEVYQYLKDNGFYYHQYIPCVEFNENGALRPYSITGDEWGAFLCEIFDTWIKKDTTKISIRVFDSILNYLVYGNYSVCYMGNNCCQYFVVEYDGSVYPCDFFVRDELLLGNVNTTSWDEFIKSEKFHNFGSLKTKWNKACDICPFIDFCNGDCQKFRFKGFQDLELSTLCKGWKKFYAYTLPRFKLLAKQIRDDKNIHSSVPVKSIKIGRNSPCPCGSGKKYKNCCLSI